MNEQELFIRFWEHESATTAKVFARIPDGSDYRPDPKSRTAQQIAWQIVCEERMIQDALESGVMTWTPMPAPSTMSAITALYEEERVGRIARWQALPDEKWRGNLAFNGRARPAAPMAWSFLFDIVHHRGQITTYLRPMGSTVPQIYGPSGDEP